MSTKAVLKYQFNIQDKFIIEMPEAHEVLSVQLQRGVPCIWAIVDVQSPKIPVEFRLVGTGHPADDVDEYVGTFQSEDSGLVFHLFQQYAYTY